MLNAVSGAIMSPMVDKLCKKVSAEKVSILYNSLEFLNENELTREAFSLLHIMVRLLQGSAYSSLRLCRDFRT